MPAPYSLDLREKAILCYENEEGTQEEISERFMIGLTTLRLWLKMKRKKDRQPETQRAYLSGKKAYHK